jgi:hypothetical protein
VHNKCSYELSTSRERNPKSFLGLLASDRQSELGNYLGKCEKFGRMQIDRDLCRPLRLEMNRDVADIIPKYAYQDVMAECLMIGCKFQVLADL